MRLPFRYQFALAPLVVVVLLACLVGYTLFELSNIHDENKITVKWELITDRVQVAIANITLTDRLVADLIIEPLASDDERLFGYLEQTKILAVSITDPVYFGEIPVSLQSQIREMESILNDPENIDPKEIHEGLISLLPALQYQHKLFLAQRRSAFIGYHRNLKVIVPRLSGALLTVLIVCIILAIGLTIWSLRILQRRLQFLTKHAHAMSAGDITSLPEPTRVRDELDNLQCSLAYTTQRLIDVFAVEKLLQGAENERRRIAMDMHDGVLADLTSIARNIDKLSNNSENEKHIELRTGIDEITQSIRRIIDDLHPQTLEILGLEAALRSFLDRHCNSSESPTCHFTFDSEIEHQLHSGQKLNLFRIITEAVHNLLRHAQCTRFEISARLVSQQIVITVEDNGIGMPHIPNDSGHGCTNIAERARALGATVDWHRSRFASGTCVELTLPLKSTS